MSSEPLLSSIIPFAGSELLGYAMGFALKKVLKWMLIIIGFLAGMFLVGIQLLQFQLAFGQIDLCLLHSILLPFWTPHDTTRWLLKNIL